jgi:hypothetical protein
LGEIDLLLGDAGEPLRDDADQLPEIDRNRPAISQPGDLWLLGPHRLLCGDATKTASFETLMGRDQAQVGFSDLPCPEPMPGAASGRANLGIGAMDQPEFTTLLSRTLKSLARCSADGAVHFIGLDWRCLSALLAAARESFGEFIDLAIWTESDFGTALLYQSQHQLVAVLKHGSAAPIHNAPRGLHRRLRSNVWKHPGVKGCGAGRDHALVMPAMKPVRLVEDAILDCSHRGGIVLDAFAGSGTTLIAAERTGRRGFGMEIEPRHVDVALQRFRSLAGVEPKHVQSGLSFSDLEAARLSSTPEPHS